MTAYYQTLLVTREGGITTIVFNRPEKRNAMSPQLHREMYQLLTELRYDKETRVIVLTGAGENFCAGQDLKQYSLEMESQPEWVREIREKVRKWRTNSRTMPQPIIARITGGVSAGVDGGCRVTWLSRLKTRLSACRRSTSAIFRQRYDPVLAQHLQAKHGLYYALSGKMMSAKEAERIGLVSKVVPQGELDNEVSEFAKCLAEKSQPALKAVKEAWYYSTCASPDVAFAISNFISQRIIRDQGGRPGLEQFVQKKLRPVSGVMKSEKD
jgi:trans-feruloyl-CoA hydratase/vanillin synthase